MNRAGMSIEGHKRVDMNLRQSKNRGGRAMKMIKIYGMNPFKRFMGMTQDDNIITFKINRHPRDNESPTGIDALHANGQPFRFYIG